MSHSKNPDNRKGDVCSHQIAFLFDNWLRRLIKPPQKIVGEYLKEGDIAVDLGCGPGFFTTEMAKMVGQSGRVIAVDLQKQMLTKLGKKAKKKGLASRIDLHQSESASIGLDAQVDFILVYWMIHETPNSKGFFQEMKNMLNKNGKILIVEPKMHTDQKLFDGFINEAGEAGLKPLDFPKGKGGRSVLLTHAAG